MEHLKSFGIDEKRGNYKEETMYALALLFNIANSEISTYLGDFELSPAKFNVLMVIKHQGGKKGINQVDISKQLIVTPSNMTRLLDKLEREGFVYRSAQEGDRRVNIIKISDKGSKVLDDAWPGYKSKLKELTDELEERDQEILASILKKWLRKLMEE